MALFFVRAPAGEPAGLVLGFAEARRQRGLAEARARAARLAFDALLSRRPR